MTTSGIYEIRLRGTRHCYIGSSLDVQSRKRQHFRALRLGKHHSAYLQNAFNKYGEDAFKWGLIEEVPDRKLLILREQYWIDTKHPTYNMNPLATSNLGIVTSEETKARLREYNLRPEVIQAKRERQLGVKRPGIGEKVRQKLKGRSASEETKALLLKNSLSRSTEERRRTATGRRHSLTTRRKQAEKATGRTHTAASLEKMRLAKEGKSQTEAHIQARVKGMMGHEVSEEARRKSAESNRAVWAQRTPEEKHRIATNRPPISDETRTRLRESHQGQKPTPQALAKKAATWEAKSDAEKAATGNKKRTTWANKSPEELAQIAAKKRATRAAKRNQPQS